MGDHHFSYITKLTKRRLWSEVNVVCERGGTSSQGTQVYAIKQSVQVMSEYFMKFYMMQEVNAG
jgi:hypothetical protein